MRINKFTLEVQNKVKVRQLPGTLGSADLRRLLRDLDTPEAEYSDTDLPDVVAMSLQDIGEQASVSAILNCFYPGQFTPGQIQNLTEELKEPTAWDEYSDLVDHQALYVCIDLLNTAFPKEYRAPSHSKLELRICSKELKQTQLDEQISPALVLRGIAQLENPECRLCRLFHEQIQSGTFPEAASIIWLLKLESDEVGAVEIESHGSSYWFEGIEKGMSAEVLLA